ncbi:hypothetical protein [Paludifilum halophilum]|uniref:Uncharacterized protein n=1 Tax=Paludifilum halophilum TaxID=1642702 RepID=A0A235B8A0_9BACL|nr:hypothetical protein [Paludifilum halophilum]OYD08543.1 hypothetical protein CHM34_06870 [Paludifilum halophilum]
MAVIPLKQKVTVTKPGELDEWGEITPGESFEHKCRIDEGSDLVRDENGQEVVSSARILIEGLVDVGYDDDVSYTNEIGQTYKEKPIRIRVLRGPSGKPWFTEVRV